MLFIIVNVKVPNTEKKCLPIEKGITYFLPINCHKALKNMGWGSGIRKKSFPGSRGQESTDSWIPDHWF